MIYELHVGTFTSEGTFDAAIPPFAELGVTALEVMPVATFPGNRGWGRRRGTSSSARRTTIRVGNRALGDRLRGHKLRLAAFCTMLAPGVPLLFVGEEHDESHPFQFFTDHIDPQLAEAAREGRRHEFEGFAAFAGEDVPDPHAEQTFERSKLAPESGDPEHRAYYRALLELRRHLPDAPVEAEVDEDARVLTMRRGDATLVMNFSNRAFEDVPPWTGVVRWPR